MEDVMADRSVPGSEPAEVSAAPQAPTQAEAAQPMSGWQRTFSALRYPNFRLWFLGQLVSSVGTWMQITAQGFLVFQLTQSTAYLGFIGFASGIPSLLLTLFGGVIADRVPRRRLLLITQFTMMLLALILAVLTFTELVRPWHIVVLALALGTANAFDAPAGQAIVVELVAREELTNAIALNATLMNVATVIGPTVAGLTYAAIGGGWCFALNGISFLAMIIALLRMRLPAHKLGSTNQLSNSAASREGPTLLPLTESQVLGEPLEWGGFPKSSARSLVSRGEP